MKLSYFPGCTLKNHAKNFEDSALCALKTLDVDVQELERWNCCGTVFSLTTDDLIHHVAPVRNLIRTKQQGVLHLLEILKNDIKFETLAQKVSKPLKGLKVASYYGCYLVRPEEIGFDDAENPVILDELMEVLGATAIDFPFKVECCGAYLTVNKPEVIADRTNQILTSALKQGADMVAVSCPLCAFNLDQRQKETVSKFPEFKSMPVVYFTQLLAIALGCPEESLRLDLHYIDPKPILKEKGLI
jgi:heterodisulfide reductase subunit B